MKITHLIKKCLYTVSSEDEDNLIQEYIRSLRIARELKLKCKKFIIDTDTDEVKAEQADIITENNDTKVSTEEEAVSAVNGPAIQASDITVVNDTEQIWYFCDLEQLLSNDSIKAITIQKRVSTMKLLMKILGHTDFRISYITPDKYSNIVDALKRSSYKEWTLKKLIGIISILYNILDLDSDLWKNSVINEYFQLLDAHTREYTLSGREREAFNGKNSDVLDNALIHFDNNNFITEGSFVQLQNLLIILLYGDRLPPLRSTWFTNMEVDAYNNKVNWIESSNLTVHMNDFKGKNDKNKPAFTFTLYNWNPLLIDVCVAYLHRRSLLIHEGKIIHKQFLSSTKLKQIIGSSNVSKYLNTLFGKGMSINMLRKIYETNMEIMFPKLSRQLLSEINRIMGHCFEVGQKIYNQPELMIVDAESSDDSENDV